MNQIAGNKVIDRKELSSQHCHSETQHTLPRTVKKEQHIIKWTTAKSTANASSIEIKKSACNNDSGSEEHSVSNESSMGRKKPEFKKGDMVYALWSGDANDKWYSGRIWDINVIPRSDCGYGPKRILDVIFDDGETETGIKEIYVMKKIDYELCLHKGEKEWIGVKNITDPDSTDEFARAVGWYQVSLDEPRETFVFASLHDALQFYDKVSRQSFFSECHVIHEPTNCLSEFDNQKRHWG